MRQIVCTRLHHIVSTLLVLLPSLLSANLLNEEYLISYGDPAAPHQIVEYFSFSCPHCSKLFQEDFDTIKREHIDTGEVYWIFHPVPVDLPTVQAMVCLRRLPNERKQILLEELLTDLHDGYAVDLALVFEMVMDIFENPTPDLRDMDAIERDPAFQAAFEFVASGVEIEGVPSVILDGHLIPGAVPSETLVSKAILSIKADPFPPRGTA